MPSLRWFSPNAFGSLVVPVLRQLGWTIREDGTERADAVVSMDAQVAVRAYGHARRHRAPLVVYLWDLPPWRLGRGRPDWVAAPFGRILRVPRPWGGYPERAGYYSRLRFVARSAAAVWVPSRHSEEDARRRFGVRPTRVPYCFDSRRFVPRGTPPAGGPATLLCVSRLAASKNHAALLRAAARLRPTPAVHIVGSGPEREPLLALARRLGVPCRIESGLSDAAIVEAYHRASAVVAPSRFEGMGLTPIEALACGVPVVASDIPPHREFLGDGPCYFPLEDDDALEDALRRALAGPAVIAPPPGLDHLTIEAAAGRFDGLLRRLLESPAAGAGARDPRRSGWAEA